MSSTTAGLDIRTYHCTACSQLLLAANTPLSSLPARTIDSSTILPLAASPLALGPTDEAYFASLYAPLAEYTFSPLPNSAVTSTNGTTALTGGKQGDGAQTWGNEIMIESEEGFEKRYLLRCVRCEVVWGYMLDWAQWSDEDKEGSQAGRRNDVVYLTTGSVVQTEKMMGQVKSAD